MTKEELDIRFDIIKDMARTDPPLPLPEDLEADTVDIDFYTKIALLFKAFRDGEKTKTEAIMNGEALRRAYYHEKDIRFRNMEVYGRNQETYKKTGQIRAEIMKHGEEMSSGAIAELTVEYMEATGDAVFAQKYKDLFLGDNARYIIKLRKTEEMKKEEAS